MESEGLMTCGLCGKDCGEQYPCQECCVLYYCSEKHRRLHFKHGHQDECLRLSRQKARDIPKINLSFANSLSVETLDQFLPTVSYSSANFWQILRPDVESEVSCCTDDEFSAREWYLASWGLNSKDIPCMHSSIPDTSRWYLLSWEDYYLTRGLSSTSTAALLMQFPLSLYIAVVLRLTLRPRLSSKSPSCLNIWYLGAQSECRILPLFLELGRLLPDWNIDLTFVGPDVPAQYSDKTLTSWIPTEDCCNDASCSCARRQSTTTCSMLSCFIDICDDIAPLKNHVQVPERRLNFAENKRKNFKLRLICGVFHEVLEDGIVPDVVFCPNAGLEVYDSWIPTITKLATEEIFTVITDYTEEAVYRSVRLLQSLNIQPEGTFLNAFRCPMETSLGGLSTPCFSNGFGFILNLNRQV